MKKFLTGIVIAVLVCAAPPARAATRVVRYHHNTSATVSHQCWGVGPARGYRAFACIDLRYVNTCTPIAPFGGCVSETDLDAVATYVCAHGATVVRCRGVRGSADQYVTGFGWLALHPFTCGAARRLCSGYRNTDNRLDAPIRFGDGCVAAWQGQLWPVVFDVAGSVLRMSHRFTASFELCH